jgi:hypothetical protein
MHLTLHISRRQQFAIWAEGKGVNPIEEFSKHRLTQVSTSKVYLR